MSRIGKKPIAVPAGVEVKIDGHTVTVKGPKGTLSRTLNEEMDIKLETMKFWFPVRMMISKTVPCTDSLVP